MRVILGSSSQARLAALREAGINPMVAEPDIDEKQVVRPRPKETTAVLAQLKGENVLARLRESGDLADVRPDNQTILISCDTLLEVSGSVYGKPANAEAARLGWYQMRGNQGVLYTGHYVCVLDGPETIRSQLRVERTLLTFADLSDEEIQAYVTTGEPERAAGGFTISGFGAAFVTRIEGDPHNVVGISLPLVRQMLQDLDVDWHLLWQL